MLTTPAYGAVSAKAPLAPLSIERRNPGPRDVQIDIFYCGVCHSDIHQCRGEFGADDFVTTRHEQAFERHARRFDLILDTLSAKHDYNVYLDLLRRDGTMVLVGLPDPTPLAAAPLIMQRQRLVGSLIGGIRETQEMLDFCAKQRIASDVEVIPIQQINAHDEERRPLPFRDRHRQPQAPSRNAAMGPCSLPKLASKFTREWARTRSG